MSLVMQTANQSNSEFKLKSELEGRIQHLAYFYNSNHDIIKLISELLEKMPDKSVDIIVYTHTDPQRPQTEIKKEDYEPILKFQKVKKIVGLNEKLNFVYLDPLPNQNVSIMRYFSRNIIFALQNEEKYLIIQSNQYINTCFFGTSDKEIIFNKVAKALAKAPFKNVTKKHINNPLNKYNNADLLITKTHAFAYANIPKETADHLKNEGFELVKINLEDKYKYKFYDLDTLITMYSDNELFISKGAPRKLKKDLEKQDIITSNYPLFKYTNSKNKEEELIGDINVIMEEKNNKKVVYIPKRTYLLSGPDTENYLEYLENLKTLWKKKGFNPIEIECDVKPYVGLRCILQSLQRTIE